MWFSLSDLDSGSEAFILLKSYSFTDLLLILLCYRDVNILTDVLTGSCFVLSCPVMKMQPWSFCMLCVLLIQTGMILSMFTVFVSFVGVVSCYIYTLYFHLVTYWHMFSCLESTYWDSVVLFVSVDWNSAGFYFLRQPVWFCWTVCEEEVSFCYTSINHHPNAKILL